jgi:hypothetical protein
MNEPSIVGPQFPPRAGSERLRLARLAREAALRVPGVVATDTGPMGLFITVGEGQRLEGVVCVAAPGDGYELSLRLVCGLVSLPALGQRVQAAVLAAGARVEIPVASVSVHIAEIVDPEELA